MKCQECGHELQSTDEYHPLELPLCDCGVGDASMPELHADDCAINLALAGMKAEAI